MTLRVGINGFGRIGRVVLRAAAMRSDIEITHINDLTSPEILAHLLKYDSVHGRFKGDVSVDGSNLIVNGRKISVSASRDPAEIAWKAAGVQTVLECTGFFRKREEAARHISAGAKKVLISAPASGEDLTVVMGVNDDLLKPEHTIISNGSCTTNCLAPVAKVLHEKFEIVRGLMTTIHSYTNDQNLLDLPHSDLRRARAGALSMIPTSTGAAKAIGLVMPELKGKMHGIAVRVPTPNVSLVDVTFEVKKSTSVEEVNQVLKAASESKKLKGILGYSSELLVSCDYNGCSYSSFVDSDCTAVMDGTLVKVLTWYDNETGFSERMLDVALKMGS